MTTSAETERSSTGRHWPRVVAALAIAGATLPAFAQRAALTQSVDEPGRNTFAMAVIGNSGQLYVGTFVVPAGKRYVIDNYTAECDVATGHSLTNVLIYATTNGVRAVASAPAHYLQADGSNGGVQVNAYIGTGQGPVYADAGTSFYVFGNDDTGGVAAKSCTFYAMGHVIALN